MASEAQRLIGISLTKIAQSRANRGGVSLHKNLLVATVLQKARYIFMEEAYNMVHYHYQTATPVQAKRNFKENVVDLTADDARTDSVPLLEDVREVSNVEFLQPPCVVCSDNQDKENQPPRSGEVSYFDLDKRSNMLREKSSSLSLKRRRAVTDWETEEAVQSILPKRSKCTTDEGDDSVFLDDATILSESVTKQVEAERTMHDINSSGSAMEIDRITSLVSIFSFTMGEGKLSRSASTPDLCSAQAKDTGDTLQQRQFIAMTV